VFKGSASGVTKRIGCPDGQIEMMQKTSSKMKSNVRDGGSGIIAQEVRAEDIILLENWNLGVAGGGYDDGGSSFCTSGKTGASCLGSRRRPSGVWTCHSDRAASELTRCLFHRLLCFHPTPRFHPSYHQHFLSWRLGPIPSLYRVRLIIPSIDISRRAGTHSLNLRGVDPSTAYVSHTRWCCLVIPIGRESPHLSLHNERQN
jgi:hypothetical protein